MVVEGGHLDGCTVFRVWVAVLVVALLRRTSWRRGRTLELNVGVVLRPLGTRALECRPGSHDGWDGACTQASGALLQRGGTRIGDSARGLNYSLAMRGVERACGQGTRNGEGTLPTQVLVHTPLHQSDHRSQPWSQTRHHLPCLHTTHQTGQPLTSHLSGATEDNALRSPAASRTPNEWQDQVRKRKVSSRHRGTRHPGPCLSQRIHRLIYCEERLAIGGSQWRALRQSPPPHAGSLWRRPRLACF